MGMKTQWPERDGQTTGLSIPLCDLEQLTRPTVPQFPLPGKEANDKKVGNHGVNWINRPSTLHSVRQELGEQHTLALSISFSVFILVVKTMRHPGNQAWVRTPGQDKVFWRLPWARDA